MTGNAANDGAVRTTTSASDRTMTKSVSALQRSVLLQSEMVRAVLGVVIGEEPVLPPATAP